MDWEELPEEELDRDGPFPEGVITIRDVPVDPDSLDWLPVVKNPVQVEAVPMLDPFEVVTMEGVMEGAPGHYLVRGVEGEFYPVEPGIFTATYLDPGDHGYSDVAGSLTRAIGSTREADRGGTPSRTAVEHVQDAIRELGAWLDRYGGD